MIRGLNQREQAAHVALERQLRQVGSTNSQKLRYYEGRNRVQPLAGTLPPEVIAQANVSVPYAAIVVDSVEERLNLVSLGEGFEPIFKANRLDTESSRVHLDALLFGTSFVRVERSANPSEPPVVITSHSALNTTAIWDSRQRQLTSALTYMDDRHAILDVIGSTIHLDRKDVSQPWRVIHRDDHGWQWLPVVRFVNKHRAGAMEGQSELSRAVRSAVDGACSVLLTMAANRIAYSSPQLLALGASPKVFTGPDGKPVSAWKTVTGRMLAIDRDEQGNLPEFKQLDVADPKPLIEQLNAYRQDLAAASGISVEHFGVSTSIPHSADAIRASEATLVRHARRCQGNFGQAWEDVANISLRMLGEDPSGFGISASWGDPETQTRAATADEVSKLVGSGTLPPRSRAVLDRLGFSRAQQDEILADLADAANSQSPQQDFMPLEA